MISSSRAVGGSWCSLRSATLILALLGALANFYATYKLLTTWFSVRWSWAGTEESEWEGLSWRFDATRVLGALVCAYFFVGGVASVVGFVGVLKRRTSNVRLFRDYSIADLAFGFASVLLFAFVSTKPAVRAMACEELSRQPDLLRSLSDSAGLNVENCESALEKAFAGVLILLAVVLFIRLQFTLTVLNYYTHLRRSEHYHQGHGHGHHHHGSSHRRSHSRSNSLPHQQRILLLSRPLDSAQPKDAESPSPSPKERSTLIYAPVRLTPEQVRSMDIREAYINLPTIREESRTRSKSEEGRIRLPVKEGEPLLQEKA